MSTVVLLYKEKERFDGTDNMKSGHIHLHRTFSPTDDVAQ